MLSTRIIPEPTNPRITKKKSTVIGYNPLSEIQTSEKLEKRKISESTGLAKFSLSPNRSDKVTSTNRNGLPVYIPIDNFKDSIDENPEKNTNDFGLVLEFNQLNTKSSPKDIQDLLSAYARKQVELARLEKQMETVKFQMTELEAQISVAHNQSKFEIGYETKQFKQDNSNGTSHKQINPTNTTESTNFATNLRKKASNAFLVTQKSIMESKMISNTNYSSNSSKTDFNSDIASNSNSNSNSNIQDMFSKFQTQFNQNVVNKSFKDIVSDVGKNIDDNNAKLKKILVNNNTEISKKTSKLFTGLLQNFSPNAISISKRTPAVDTSFDFENVNKQELEMSIIISEEGDISHSSVIYQGSSFIDIDEYESGTETEIEEEADNRI